MDGKMLARIAAVVFVGIAITATAIELTRKDEDPTAAPLRRASVETGPMRIALWRCRDMGEAATHDPACLKAWAENRDHFLRQDDAPSEPAAPRARESAPASNGASEIQPEPAQAGVR